MKKQVLLAVFLGASVAVFAQTNMTLEGTQTNTGNKTFLNGTLFLRNANNSYSAGFSNTITANRTYTLPNASGTLALTSNLTWATITGKPTTIGGYGITDFNSLGDARWLRLSGTNTLTGPTSLTGNDLTFYGNHNVFFGVNGGSSSNISNFLVTANGDVDFVSGVSTSYPNSLYQQKNGELNFAVTKGAGVSNILRLNSTGIRIELSGTDNFSEAADYTSNYTARSYTAKSYVDSKLLGLSLPAPTLGEAGKSIRWNAAGTAWEYFTPGGGGGEFDFATSAELGYYSPLKGTVSGVAQVPHLAFRGDATRAITDGVTDVYLGPNNGNTASAAGGNIGIGSYNLNQINAAGTWTGTPFFSYFRGDRNIAIGFQNGMSLTGGAGNAASTNILIGNNVLKASTQQSYNIFIGFQSAMNMSIPLNGFDGQSNVALGQYNMQNVTGGTASFNTAIGPSVLRQTTSISSANTFVGSGAGLNATIVGSNNTVVGDDGFRNVSWTTSGNSFNTGLGSGVFRQAVEGLTNSTAVGTSSMRWGGGSDNSALGRSSGWTLRGTGNTAIGFQSAHVADNSYTTTAGTPYTGSNSTFIGYRAGYKAVDAAISNVIVIGNDFQPSLQPGNVYLGSGNELIAFTGGTEKLRISSSGAIIKDGDLTIDNNSNGGNPSVYLGSGTEELNRYLQVANSQGLSNSAGLKAGGVLVADSYSYANPAKNDLVVKGKVGIGTPLLTNPNNYMLAVNGKIGAKDVQIETSSTTWPDYVFSPSYQLPSLQAVEKFIQENKHLENVPSAEEIAQNGHSLGEMDKILLKKVEELTLYIIQQQKEIEALKKLLEKK